MEFMTLNDDFLYNGWLWFETCFILKNLTLVSSVYIEFFFNVKI